jgi:hypothetical protein
MIRLFYSPIAGSVRSVAITFATRTDEMQMRWRRDAVMDDELEHDRSLLIDITRE